MFGLRVALGVFAAGMLVGGGTARAASPCGALLTVDQCLDDFTCYKTSVVAQNFVTVTLADQFEVVTAEVARPRRLCTPSNKNNEGVVDSDTHLQPYYIRRQSAEHVERTGIRVHNQLGDVWVDTIKPSQLLVPAAIDLNAQPGQPDPNSHVDHYKCYRVKVTRGTPKFGRNTRVSVSDEFSGPARDLALRKPRFLCVPVNKNGSGTANDDVNLLCYAAKPAIGEPKHAPVQGIFTNNQFGPAQVDTRWDPLESTCRHASLSIL